MGKNMLLGAAIVVVLAAGCSREQASDTTPGRTAASEQTDPDPARSATPATPSRVGEGGTLVTDASDVTDTLGVFTAGEAAPAYVVDSNRRAVYLLEGDADGSGCKDACLPGRRPCIRCRRRHLPAGTPRAGCCRPRRPAPPRLR